MLIFRIFFFFFTMDRKIIVVRVGGDDDRERVMYPLGLVQHQLMMMWAHVGFWRGDGKEALFSFQLFSMEGKFLAFWQLMCCGTGTRVGKHCTLPLIS